MAGWPKVIRRGPLKGQEFDSQAAYDQARAEVASDVSGGEDSTPKPRERAPRGGKVTREMADGLVQMANLALAIVPATRADQLDEIEAKALSLAILDTARTNRAFANIIVKVCSVQSNARLASTVGCIVAVRLARHEANLPIIGKVPAEMALPATMMLYALANEDPGEVPAPPPREQPANGVYESSPLMAESPV